MLIGLSVGVLVGVMVEVAVAVGIGVLLGDGVAVGVRVLLGITIVVAGSAMTVLVGALTLPPLHPVAIKTRNSPKAIPGITRKVILFLPINSFMMNDSDPAAQL
jgi:hypothetical protein